jgi:hypothetical protein
MNRRKLFEEVALAKGVKNLHDLNEWRSKITKAEAIRLVLLQSDNQSLLAHLT